MLRKPIRKLHRVALGVASGIVLVIGYTALCYRSQQLNPNQTTIPSWSQMLGGLRSVVRTDPAALARWKQALANNPDASRPRPKLVADATATGTHLFLGLGLSVIGSMFLGVMMGCFRRVEAFLLPPMAFLAKIPATAALPVFLKLAGQGQETFFVSIVTFGVLPAMSQSIYLAAREVSDEYLSKAYTLGASDTAVVWTIMVRSILPHVMDAARLAIGPAIVYLIAAEMLFSDIGFGYRIRYDAKTGMTVVFPYLVILAIFGFTMDFSLRWLQRKTCPWFVPEESR